MPPRYLFVKEMFFVEKENQLLLLGEIPKYISHVLGFSAGDFAGSEALA